MNDKHVKSLTRRASARKELEKYKESLEDFEKAYEIERTSTVGQEIDFLMEKLNIKVKIFFFIILI